MIETIKITREKSGLDLKGAKEAVEEYIRVRSGLPSAGEREKRGDSPDLPRLAVSVLEDGQLIEAVKHTREAMGCSLKDAKETVERFLGKNPNVKEKCETASSKALRTVIGKVVFVGSVLGLVALGYLHYFGDR